MTINDIVDELRQPLHGDEAACEPLMRDAADEIERLRGEGDWEYGYSRIVDGNPNGLIVSDEADDVWKRDVVRVRRRPAGPWEPAPKGEGA